MKVILVATTLESPEKDVNFYPIGLAYLHAEAEKAGHEVQTYDFYNADWEKSRAKIRQLFEEKKPDVVGFSCITENRTTTFEAMKLVKSISPQTKVVLGNAHASIMYSQILSHFNEVDVICLGESDESFIELLTAFNKANAKGAKKVNLKNIEGLAFKDGNKVIVTGKRDKIKDLDSLPFPKHEIFEENLKRSKTANMSTSRGCPCSCTFCGSSHYWGRCWISRSPKNVVDEIEYLVKRFPFIDRIHFYDDAFGIDKERAIAVCKEKVNRGLNIAWSCSVRATSINPEVAYWMKKSNCVRVGFGVESGSDKILKNIGKNVTKDDILKAYNTLVEAKIPVKTFFMAGNQGETWDTIKESMDLIDKMPKAELDTVMVAKVYPGTYLYELAKQHGLLKDDYWLTDGKSVYYTVEHTEAELRKMSHSVTLHHWENSGYLNIISHIFRFVKDRPDLAVKYFFEKIGLHKKESVNG